MKRYIRSAIMDVTDMDRDSQLELAGSLNTSIDSLMKLALGYFNWSARIRATYSLKYIANSSHPERLFEGNPDLRYEMANFCEESDILGVLSDDTDMFVRSSVSENEYTAVDTLDKLSHDSDAYVRENVADNPNTPDYTLARLSNDESFLVRRGVAKNPNTPQTILVKLSKDENDSVRESALSNSNFKGDSV